MSESYIEVGGRCGEYFRRNLVFDKANSKTAILTIMAKTGGTDAYYCTYLFDKKERGEGTKYISPLYFDIDGNISTDEGFESLRMAVLSLVIHLDMELRLKANELKIYFSGSKGFHIFVSAKTLGIKPHEKLNIIYKLFVQHMQKIVEHGELIDTKIYDNKRLIRIPGTVNSKTGLYKIPIQYSELRTIKREELLERARTRQPEYKQSTETNVEAAARFRECVQKLAKTSPQRSCGKREIPKTKQSLPVCMRYLLQANVAEGGRNNYVAMLGSILIQNGYSEEEALNILMAWDSNLDKPLGEQEVLTTLKSAARLAQEGHGYGCTSIREKDVFRPREVCTHCRIYQKTGR